MASWGSTTCATLQGLFPPHRPPNGHHGRATAPWLCAGGSGMNGMNIPALAEPAVASGSSRLPCWLSLSFPPQPRRRRSVKECGGRSGVSWPPRSLLPGSLKGGRSACPRIFGRLGSRGRSRSLPSGNGLRHYVPSFATRRRGHIQLLKRTTYRTGLYVQWAARQCCRSVYRPWRPSWRSSLPSWRPTRL